MIIEGNLVHDGNPAMRWCVGNAIAEIDPDENKKSSKKKSTGRIDGVSATFTDLAGALEQSSFKPSVYETRGLRVIRGGVEQ